MSCFDLTHAPVATAARAAATELAREHVDPAWSRRIRHGGDSHPEMSSSPGSSSVGLARAHPQQKPRLWSLPARLGPVTVHPTRWGVGWWVSNWAMKLITWYIDVLDWVFRILSPPNFTFIGNNDFYTNLVWKKLVLWSFADISARSSRGKKRLRIFYYYIQRCIFCECATMLCHSQGQRSQFSSPRS